MQYATYHNESCVGKLPCLRGKVKKKDVMSDFSCTVAIEAPPTLKGTERSQIMNLVKDLKENEVKYKSRNIICGMFRGTWEGWINALRFSGHRHSLVLLFVSKCQTTELPASAGVATKLCNTERILHYDEILSYTT